MPPRLRILLDICGAVLAAAVAAYIAHYPAAFRWPADALFAAGAGAAAVVLAWRTTFRFVATVAALAAWTFLIPAGAPHIGMDYKSRMAALALYRLLIAVLAHRTPGRPWITAAAALAATLVVAYIATSCAGPPGCGSATPPGSSP